MTDVDRALRAALDGEIAGVAAPPFDGLLRRRRQRRERRAITAVAVAVAVAAGVAVAQPRDGATRLQPVATPTPSLRPIGLLLRDPAAEAAIGACMEARGYPVPAEGLWVLRSGTYYEGSDPKLRAFPAHFDACAAASGYDGGQVLLRERLQAVSRRSEMCRAFEHRLGETTLVGSGDYAGTPWTVRAVARPDGGFCLFETYAGKLVGHYPGDDGGADPALANSLMSGDGHVFSGGLDPAAVTLDAVVDGVPLGTFRTVTVPGVEGRVFYAFVARIADSNHFSYRIVARDEDGRQVGPERGLEIPPGR